MVGHCKVKNVREREWREKGGVVVGGREGEADQANVSNLEGIKQACLIGVYFIGLGRHIPFPHQPLSR